MSLALSTDEQDLLRALNTHGVRFLIVGLSSALLQGAHVVTQDIDLWVEDLSGTAFLQAVRSVGAFYIPAGIAGTNPPMLGPASVRIFDLVTDMHGLNDFNSEYNNAKTLEIKGIKLKILPLARIIASKEAANREKDRAVLPILRAALAVSKKV